MIKVSSLRMLTKAPDDFDAIVLAENLLEAPPTQRAISGRDLGFLCAKLLLLNQRADRQSDPEPMPPRELIPLPVQPLAPALLPILIQVVKCHRVFESSKYSRGELAAQRDLDRAIKEMINQIQEEYPDAFK